MPSSTTLNNILKLRAKDSLYLKDLEIIYLLINLKLYY